MATMPPAQQEMPDIQNNWASGALSELNLCNDWNIPVFLWRVSEPKDIR